MIQENILNIKAKFWLKWTFSAETGDRPRLSIQGVKTELFFTQARRQACCLWQRQGGDGRGEESGILWFPVWAHLQEDHNHRLWRA